MPGAFGWLLLMLQIFRLNHLFRDAVPQTLLQCTLGHPSPTFFLAVGYLPRGTCGRQLMGGGGEYTFWRGMGHFYSPHVLTSVNQLQAINKLDCEMNFVLEKASLLHPQPSGALELHGGHC